MARPRAIEEGAKRSRELIEQIKEGQQKAEEATKAAVKQDLEGLDGSDDDQGQNDPKPGTDDAGKPGGQATTPPDPAASAPDKKPDNDPVKDRIRELENENARLAQANTVLRSKYDAEVPRLAAEIRELKDQIKQQPTAGDTAPVAANTDTVEKIKASLADEYPPDVIDNLDKLIRASVAAHMPTGAKTGDDQRVEALQKTVEQTRHQMREQQLTALVPDWQAIQQNEYAAWLKFLQHRDPVSGRERNDFLQEAWNAHDVARVAEIFKLYKHERDASKPSGQEPPPTSPDDGGRRVTPDPTQPGKKVYPRSYIAHVEQMARRGEFRGRESELNRLRHEFRMAAAEGRVNASA